MQRRIGDIAEVAVQTFGKIEPQLAHVAAGAQFAHAHQPLANQQIVVVVAGLVLFPGVGALDAVELQRDLLPSGVVGGVGEIAQPRVDQLLEHQWIRMAGFRAHQRMRFAACNRSWPNGSLLEWEWDHNQSYE